MVAAHSIALTRWSVQLQDKHQEWRFRRYIVPAERRAVLGTTAIVAGIDIVTGILGSPPLTHLLALPLLAVAALLLAPSAATNPVPRTYAAITVICAAIAAMVATNDNTVLLGAVLLPAGVIYINLVGRITLIGVTIDGLVFSTLVTAAWLISEPGPTGRQAALVIAITALVHVLGYIEARRAQAERRTVFAQQELLSTLSETDELTGLINRRGWQHHLDRQWRRWKSDGTPFAVIMFDIDHFKDFNDTFGHPAGDHALRLVADTLSRHVTAADGHQVCRYGGEEFVCLLSGVDFSAAIAVANDLRSAIASAGSRLPKADNAIELTISGGVAAPNRAMRHTGELMQLVDERLYTAKRGGRNSVAPERGS